MQLLSMTLKYTIATKGQLLYRRRFPTKLRSHPQIKGEFYTWQTSLVNAPRWLKRTAYGWNSALLFLLLLFYWLPL
jgi:hypothetical protein